MLGLSTRRVFLSRAARAVASMAAAGAAGTLGAVEPFRREPPARFGLSCAAYSLRKYLDLRKPTMTLEDFIEKCARWGTDGVELTEYYFQKPITAASISRLKRQAALWGQDITGSPIGNSFTLPPGEERRKEIDKVLRWIDVSADLGSPAIRIFAGNAPAGVDASVARKWVMESIEECCEAASRRGVFLALENHGGVVATVEGLLEIVKAVRCEWLGVNLDTGNFHGPDPYEEMARAAPYAITCQVKTEIGPAGGSKQDADMARIVGILRKAAYRGYVTLEYEGDEEPMTAVPRHLLALRKHLG